MLFASKKSTPRKAESTPLAGVAKKRSPSKPSMDAAVMGRKKGHVESFQLIRLNGQKQAPAKGDRRKQQQGERWPCVWMVKNISSGEEQIYTLTPHRPLILFASACSNCDIHTYIGCSRLCGLRRDMLTNFACWCGCKKAQGRYYRLYQS